MEAVQNCVYTVFYHVKEANDDCKSVEVFKMFHEKGADADLMKVEPSVVVLKMNGCI